MTETKQTVEQSYKNPAQAFAKFIKAGGYPIGRAQFYEDCKSYNLANTDKTVDLAGLLAYVREKCDIKPETGQSLVEINYTKDMRALEMREKIATVESAERKNRKEDDRWMEKVEHEIQMAAFAGLLQDMLQQQSTIKLSELIYLAGGNMNLAAEFAQGLEEMIATAMAEAAKEATRSVAFEDDEEDNDEVEQQEEPEDASE